MKNITFCGSLVAACLLVSSAANADIIYGAATTNNTGPITRYNTDTDVTDTLLDGPGNMGMAFSSDGTLYGMKSGSPSVLYTIDLDTGATTSVGTQAYNAQVESLAINGSDEAYTGASATLWSVNLADGSAVSLGGVAGMGDIDGLSFNPVPVEGPNGTIPAGTLFAIDGSNIYTIDINTVTATLLISVQSGWESIAFAPDGTVYVNVSGQQYNTVDLVTGTLTLVGGPGVWGAAVLPGQRPQPTAEPEPAAQEPYIAVPVPVDHPGALVAMLLAILAMGAFTLRRSP